MKKCVFAGTFDPFTVGHAETVGACLKLFDEVIVAVAVNRAKQPMFSESERLGMLERTYAHEPRVKPILWEGAVVDLLRRENTPFCVRGVRNAADFEYETSDFYASRDLDPDMVTLYIPAELRLSHVSSTLVKNCILFNQPFENYVPSQVYAYIREKLCSEKK